MTIPATILVVDDEPAMLQAVAEMLRAHEFHVLTAEDGLQALQVLGEQSPDLIITDIMMPRMNGYQLHQRVSANPSWIWIPFLFLSGKSDEADLRFGKELGVDDYLTKPVDPEDLLAAVLGRLKRFGRLEGQRAKMAVPPTPEQDVQAFQERHGLTEREGEVLRLLVRGMANEEIALDLRIAPTTVKSHVSNILSKLGVGSRAEAVAMALGVGGVPG
jgi:DNA-binding NarL/FixJ family response regulator